jgi:hypothetical protein
MLPHKTAFALPINLHQVHRALPLDEADDLTPRISAGSTAACARDRASDALLRPSPPSEVQLCGRPRPTLVKGFCFDISEQGQHDNCRPKSCGLASYARPSVEFLSSAWLLTWESGWWTARDVKLLLPIRQSRGLRSLMLDETKADYDSAATNNHRVFLSFVEP